MSRKVPVRQLSEAELRQFEHEGYLVAEGILPPDELEPVIDELTRAARFRGTRIPDTSSRTVTTISS